MHIQIQVSLKYDNNQKVVFVLSFTCNPLNKTEGRHVTTFVLM